MVQVLPLGKLGVLILACELSAVIKQGFVALLWRVNFLDR
jgi:hypothetical protein